MPEPRNAHHVLGVGAEIGAPLTDSFTGNSFSNSLITSLAKRYTVGPSFEWMGNDHFGFETAALYKHSGYKQDVIVAGSQTNMNSWEFPFLGKAAIPGACNARVFLSDHAKPSIPFRIRRCNRRGVVLGAVVDDHTFPVVESLSDQTVERGAKESAGIVSRNNDADDGIDHCCKIIPQGRIRIFFIDRSHTRFVSSSARRRGPQPRTAAV